MYLRAIGRGFTQMIAYFLVMNSKRCIYRLVKFNDYFSVLQLYNFTTNGRKGRQGSIQKLRVPTTARYLIKAWGARGGTHSTNDGDYPGTFYGGRGAFKKGTFRLNKGTVLNIVVGQRGGNSVEVKGGQSTSRTAAELGLSVEDNAGTGDGGACTAPS